MGKKMYTRNIWITLWAILYVISLAVECYTTLANKGLEIIGNQYYRFFTGLLLHANFFHFILNAIALYWVCHFLYGQVNEIKLMIFSLVSSVLANAIFSFIYPDSQSIGGSPVVFSLIALIVVFQLLKKDPPEFKLKTTCGQWIVGYAILGNIPIFSGNISTLVVHAIAFFVAFILGTAGCKMNSI